jgi:hypothetical protein
MTMQDHEKHLLLMLAYLDQINASVDNILADPALAGCADAVEQMRELAHAMLASAEAALQADES